MPQWRKCPKTPLITRGKRWAVHFHSEPEDNLLCHGISLLPRCQRLSTLCKSINIKHAIEISSKPMLGISIPELIFIDLHKACGQSGGKAVNAFPDQTEDWTG
jgi:hypothetical protein